MPLELASPARFCGISCSFVGKQEKGGSRIPTVPYFPSPPALAPFQEGSDPPLAAITVGTSPLFISHLHSISGRGHALGANGFVRTRGQGQRKHALSFIFRISQDQMAKMESKLRRPREGGGSVLSAHGENSNLSVGFLDSLVQMSPAADSWQAEHWLAASTAGLFSQASR